MAARYLDTSVPTADAIRLPRRTPAQIRMLAYHQAGHLIAAHLLGLDVSSISIDKDEVGPHHTGVFEPLAPIVASGPEQECRARAQAEDQAVALYAGGQAENLVRSRGFSPEWYADQEGAQHLLGAMRLDPRTYGYYSSGGHLVARARMLINANERTLNDVADGLLARGTVTIADLVEILERHPFVIPPNEEDDD
jgi:hypothetical protein